MTENDLKQIYIPHLRTQFERGRPILFTGAGFSCAAKNMLGENLPTATKLKETLWSICFAEMQFDPTTSLQDLYEYALKRNRNQLTELLAKTLSVDSKDIPDWYKLVFSLPWAHIYTLNIDDLERAVARSFDLPRKIVSISAVEAEGGSVRHPGELEVLHLNGVLDGVPDKVTFSTSQYARRLSTDEPTYRRLAAELLTSPFVFVGAGLEEPPLWQHLEMRRMRGGRDQREFRPRSYLVIPTLSPAKQALLAEFNVVWVPMKAEEFATEVLGALGDSRNKGLSYLDSEANQTTKPRVIPEVSTVAVNPHLRSDYLLGQQPIWADIQSGRAAERDDDQTLWKTTQDCFKRANTRGVLVVSGTAGSGKSTALMKIALRFSAQGTSVGWVCSEDDLSPRDVRTSMKQSNAPRVLAIDDADIFGSELTRMIREIAGNEPFPLILLAIRSGRVDRVIHTNLLSEVPHGEHSIPTLADSDIDRLIEILDRENRLGTLKGKSLEQQRSLFREQSGRELLVAMIQATSGGEKFEDKAVEEMTSLSTDAARVYRRPVYMTTR